MAFSISYVFTARERYSAIARKVAVANEKVRRSAITASKAISNKLSPALTSIRIKAQQTKVQIASLARNIKAKLEPAMRGVRNVGLGMTAAVSLPFLLAARSATKFASESEETRSKFATIFRDISAESEQVADDFAKNFGLAGATSRLLISDTGDLLTGFGFTQEGALDLSRQVNELAVDLASFTNFSGGAEGASAALTKALLGERESLKSLGIAITEDLVKKKITTLLSEGNKFASLAEAKAIATLAIAVDQSGNAIGDYSRTQRSSANISRLLTEKTKELKETYGKLLLPIQDKINNSLIAMTEKLNMLSPGMQKVILVVGGVLAAMGPLLLIIGSIGLALPVLAAGFGAVGAAIAFLTGPIGLVLILIASIVLFMKTSEKARQVVGGAIFKIVGFFQSMGAVVGDVLFKIVAISEMTGELIGAALGKIGDFIRPVTEFIGGLIFNVIESVKKALNFLGGVFDKFKGFAATLGLIDLPDKEVALNIIPPAAIPDQQAALNLVPTGVIPDQQIALTATIPDQQTALKLIPTAIPDQKAAVTLVLSDIPDQKTALTLVPTSIPDQKVALDVIPSAALADQEIALKLLPPENFPGAEGVTNTQAVENLITASPAVATASANATVNGQITVSATEGSRIDSIKQENVFRGAQGNLGLGVASQ